MLPLQSATLLCLSRWGAPGCVLFGDYVSKGLSPCAGFQACHHNKVQRFPSARVFFLVIIYETTALAAPSATWLVADPGEGDGL